MREEPGESEGARDVGWVPREKRDRARASRCLRGRGRGSRAPAGSPPSLCPLLARAAGSWKQSSGRSIITRESATVEAPTQLSNLSRSPSAWRPLYGFRARPAGGSQRTSQARSGWGGPAVPRAPALVAGPRVRCRGAIRTPGRPSSAHTSGPRLHCRRGLLLPLRSSLPLSLPPRPARRACLLSSAPPSASSLSAGPSPRRPSVSSIISETQASVRPRRSHGPARLVPSAVTAGALAFLPLRLTGPSLLLYSSLSRRSRERPRTP